MPPIITKRNVLANATTVSINGVSLDPTQSTTVKTISTENSNLLRTYNVGAGDSGNFLGEYWTRSSLTNFTGGSSNTSTSIVGGEKAKVTVDTTGQIARVFGRQTEVNVTSAPITTILMNRMVVSAQNSATAVTSIIGNEYEYFLGVTGGGATTIYDNFVPDTKTGTIGAHYHIFSGARGTDIYFAGKIINHAGHTVSPGPHPGISSTLYYSPQYATLTPAAIGSGIAYFTPMYIPGRATLTEMGIRVTTSATNSGIKLGIYTSLNGYPYKILNSLFGEANPENGEGTVAATSTGAKTLTISRVLDGGIYWLAMIASTSAIQVNYGAFTAWRRAEILGSTADNTAAASNKNICYAARAYGSGFVDIITSPATQATRQLGAAEPHMWVRAGT